MQRSIVRGSIPLIAITIVAGTALAGVPARSSAEQPPSITVTPERYVTADGRPVGAIPAEILGANHRWPDDGKGMWDPVTNTPQGGIAELSRKTGLHSIRYPGGTVANLFDFTKAVGPQEDRGCQTSGGFANGLFEPTDSRYGPDENERYVDLIGGETMIMVPTINRTAADAADYVEYMNTPADGAASNPNGGVDWAEVRAANGHAAPYGVEVWEFGNEPYLPNQRYWRSPDPAVKVRQFIEGGWQRQTAESAPYADNDGLFSGCDLVTRRTGTGEPGQSYRVRYAPIALPGDEVGAAGVGDGPIEAPVLSVDGTMWQRVDDLASAGPDDAVYTIDQAAGTVHFGDGRHGRIPPDGARLSIEYTTGVQEGFLAFRDAMKAVDPTITVCAGWGKREFIDAMGSRPYDCLGVHSYSTPPPDGTPLRYHKLQWASGARTEDLAAYRRLFATYFPAPADRPELIITEYGVLNVRIPNYGATLAHVLYMADLIAGQLENDVRLSITSNLNGLGPADPSRRSYGNLFGASPTFVDTGRARMMSLYARMVGGVTITTNIANNRTVTAPNGDYDVLRAVASCQGPTTQLLVINRALDGPVTAQVDLPGATGRVVTISTLTGASESSFNTDAEPEAVKITTTQRRVTGQGLDHAFAPHSVTLLEVTSTGHRSGCPVR